MERSGAQLTALYVCGLDPEVHEEHLYQLFSPYGQVTSACICRQPGTNTSLCRGYVNFLLVEDAEEARLAVHCEKFNGRPIRVISDPKIKRMRDSGRANLYVRNLHKDLDENALFDLFSLFGTVLCCKIVRTDAGVSKGFGFVQFDTQRSADKAVEGAHRRTVNEKALDVQRFIPKNERISRSNQCNLYVKNFSSTVTDKDLRDLFSKYGTITSCTVMKNSDGSSRCFGFVAFDRPSALEAACNELNGKEHEGRILYVARAQKKQQRFDELSKMFSDAEKKNIFVKFLEKTCDEEGLREMFAPFGTIVSTKVATFNGTCLGYGFVSFTSEEEAARAVAEMHGKAVGEDGASHPLHVALAQSRTERMNALMEKYARQAEEGENRAEDSEETEAEALQDGKMPVKKGTQLNEFQDPDTLDSDIIAFYQSQADEMPSYIDSQGEEILGLYDDKYAEGEALEYYGEQESQVAGYYLVQPPGYYAPYYYEEPREYYADEAPVGETSVGGEEGETSEYREEETPQNCQEENEKYCEGENEEKYCEQENEEYCEGENEEEYCEEENEEYCEGENEEEYCEEENEEYCEEENEEYCEEENEVETQDGDDEEVEDEEIPQYYESEEEEEEEAAALSPLTPRRPVIRYNFAPASEWMKLPLPPPPNVYIPPELRRKNCRYPYVAPPRRAGPWWPRPLPPPPPPPMRPLPRATIPMAVFQSPLRSYFRNYTNPKGRLSPPRWADLMPALPCRRMGRMTRNVPPPAEGTQSTDQQKRVIGVKLFEAVEKLSPEMAAEITNMLLAIDNVELIDMMENNEALKKKVEEAIAIIMVHEKNAKERSGYDYV